MRAAPAHRRTAAVSTDASLRGVGSRDANFAILVSLSVCHLLNDTNQSLLSAIYPVLKDSYRLDFVQIGFITLAFQVTASMLQPVVGMVTDRRPLPFSLPVGMASTLAGLLLLSVAGSYGLILLAAALIGIGSAVFHPEASRVARMASGGRYGFAQSLFQVGGSSGSALGPLLAAFVVVPHGQASIAWFALAALVAIALLANVSAWYHRHPSIVQPRDGRQAPPTRSPLPRGRTMVAVAVLIALLFSKNVYTASLSSYYTFYLIQKFGLSVQDAQILLFVFLAAVVAGTLAGGQIGDRFGRKPVIWFSILGALPFALLLPYATLFWTGVLSVVIGLILSSAFSAILVYAQDLLPGRVGLVAGIFYGFSFGLAGLGAAALGHVADLTSIETVYRACSFLPLIGLLTAFLPKLGRH
ncbi:MFS transporter [Ramlibacter sp. RBP-2]|uniref:MFS transporter n=1 Tax=Ramlibacter lithotrophicus TaxID=2606681 RepID=A0A7X6I612_9BURK|nr:MFS transporter [Ramlibacter lithotrophicus]